MNKIQAEKLDIDYYPGGNKVLFVLTGLGGDTKGYENKYVKIAENAKNNHNMTVFVTGTPKDSWDYPRQYINTIIQVLSTSMTERDIENYEIYAMGHSAGGTFMAWYAYKYSSVQKVMAINPVININYHRLKNGLSKFYNENITLIIGEKDQCIFYAQMLNSIKNDKFNCITIPNANHEFIGMLDEFIELPEKYLY